MQAARIPRFFLYGEAPSDPDERALHVETIEARSRQYGWEIRPHTHRDLHQLLFITRGKGTATAESTTVAFRPPVLIYVPSGTVHAFAFAPATRGHVASIGDARLREISHREPRIGALFEVPRTLELSAAAVRATDLEEAFGMLLREFGRAAVGRDAALDALFTVILANALRLSHLPETAAGSGHGRQLALVARFRERLESRYRRSDSLADYAAALNVSESRLREACLKVTERPPIQLVHQRVLLEAKRLLLYTHLTVTEIAYELGFDDPAYFTRFFARRTGVSPRRFRMR